MTSFGAKYRNIFFEMPFPKLFFVIGIDRKDAVAPRRRFAEEHRCGGGNASGAGPYLDLVGAGECGSASVMI